MWDFYNFCEQFHEKLWGDDIINSVSPICILIFISSVLEMFRLQLLSIFSTPCNCVFMYLYFVMRFVTIRKRRYINELCYIYIHNQRKLYFFKRRCRWHQYQNHLKHFIKFLQASFKFLWKFHLKLFINACDSNVPYIDSHMFSHRQCVIWYLRNVTEYNWK